MILYIVISYLFNIGMYYGEENESDFFDYLSLILSPLFAPINLGFIIVKIYKK